MKQYTVAVAISLLTLGCVGLSEHDDYLSGETEEIPVDGEIPVDEYGSQPTYTLHVAPVRDTFEVDGVQVNQYELGDLNGNVKTPKGTNTGGGFTLPNLFGSEISSADECLLFTGGTCALPHTTTVTLRTCTPSTFDVLYSAAHNSAAVTFANRINAVPNTNFNVQVDLDNCYNPHSPYVVFSQFGQVAGTALGQTDQGSVLAPPWYDYVTNNDNTVTLDNYKLYNYWLDNTQDQSSYSDFIVLMTNVATHEYLHALGFGHTRVPPHSSSPADIMRGLKPSWLNNILAIGAHRENIMTIFDWD